MKKRDTLTAIFVLVLVGIGYFFVTQGTENRSEVVIGVIAGTTGQYASAGEGYLKGFELAREEWNKTHSLQFKAIVEDDGFDAKKGVSAYKKLKDIDGVDAYAVLSTFTIDAIESQLIEEDKPVALGFEQSVSAKDDNIFQVLPAARPIQEKLGEHVQSLGYTNPLMLVSNNSPAYQNFADGFVDGYVDSVSQEIVTGDITSYPTLSAKVGAQNYDVVIFFAAPRDGALITRELIRQLGERIPQLAYDQSIQSGAREYKEILADDLEKLNGSIIALSRNDLTEEFKELYVEEYGEEPVFAVDMGYNSFLLLAGTYSPDSSKWVGSMKNISFIGADGNVTFDEVGLRIPNVYFAEFRDGEVVVE